MYTVRFLHDLHVFDCICILFHLITMPFMNLSKAYSLSISLRGSSEVVDRKTNDKKSSSLEGERVAEECLSQESKDLTATTVYVVYSLI